MWLSLARAPGLGPGGRRFESCHPDEEKQHENAAFFYGKTLEAVIEEGDGKNKQTTCEEKEALIKE